MTRDSIVLDRYRQAIERTAQLGSGDPGQEAFASYQERAAYRLERMREMVVELGSPLASTPIVHVAGTSGKGSTATAIASILTSAGYKTGLHTSPYLQVATEKLQIDRELIAGDAFAALVDQTLDRLAGAGFEPSYGQLWMAMVHLWFEQQSVDVAVIEVGAGGRFDLSNVVHPMVSVITEIGMDHVAILGPTLEEIAWHKAGIIEPFVPVVTAVQDSAALAVIEQEADRNGSELYRITPDPRGFKRTNEATAKLAAELLGFDIPEEDVDDGLARARIAGRAERIQDGPTVVLDGAHNRQKIEAMTTWWGDRFPGSQPVVVAGFLDSKDSEGMLEVLVGLASALVLTEPSLEEKAAAPSHLLEQLVLDAGFDGPVHIEHDPVTAVDIAIELAERLDRPVLVTGSLYLVGNVRGRWYPDDEVLLQRTSWPMVRKG